MKDRNQAIRDIVAQYGPKDPELVSSPTTLPLALPSFGQAEVIEAMDALLSGWLTMGNRVFGCDDCQLVCPWNRYASVGDPAFAPRHALDDQSLIDLFQWSEEEFLLKTEGNPLRRAGYVKFLENIAIGLGNSASHIGKTIEILELKHGMHGAVLDEHIDWAVSRLRNQTSESERDNA